MRKLSYLFMCLLVSSAGIVSAKCPFAEYRVEGTLSLPPGVKPSEIRIYLFPEGARRTTQYPGPDFAHPGADGSYEVQVWLSTDSGNSQRHNCQHVVNQADLFIVGDRVYGYRRSVVFEQSKKSIRRSLRASAQLEPIELESLREDER